MKGDETVTRNEFKDFIKNTRDEIGGGKDQEINRVLVEGRAQASAVREHDPILSDKIMATVHSLDDMREYIMKRCEVVK
jgi:hypothetical protein